MILVNNSKDSSHWEDSNSPLIFALFPDVDALLSKAPPRCSKPLLLACQSGEESRDWRSGRSEGRSECEALCVLKLSFLSLHSIPHQSLNERRGKTHK